MEMLGDPHQSFPSIHVAGTNGKGSTSHMLASIFQASGKKVGLYTSPHYVDFRERIRINGKMISEKAVIRFVESNRDKWSAFQPSFFEITVAMAFDHFRNNKVDMAVIETGLGGRLDSTNIITPMLSVITNIGFDHMKMLGDTLPLIATEKAGIIKNQVPVVIGEWQRESAPVFRHQSSVQNAPIHFASRHIRLSSVRQNPNRMTFHASYGNNSWLKQISTDLTGPYQVQNCKTVLEAIWCWNKYYPKDAFPDKVIKRGLENVIPSTGMVGRWMIIKQHPLIIADAAHNVHGMKAMLPALLKIRAPKKHFVLGFVSDKDITEILKLFPKNANYYWCAPDIPRGKPSSETQAIGATLKLNGLAYPNVLAALASALLSAGKKDLIFIGGSSYVVGDFLASKNPKKGGL